MSDDIWIKRIKELENYISDNQDKIEELEKKMGVFDKIDIIQTQIEEIKEQFTKWVGEFGNETLKYKEEIEELEKWKGIINKDHQKAVIDIDKLEKKVDLLDMEKKLKIDYILKMNQLVKNDKAHQALYDKLFKEIAELKANFDDHTHLVWFNKIKELEEEDDHIKHVINVNRTGVSNLFTNYGVIKEVLRGFMNDVRYILDKEIHSHSMDYLNDRVEEHKTKLSGETKKKEPPFKLTEVKYPKRLRESDLEESGGEKERSAAHTGLCAFPNCNEIGILRENGKIKCEAHYYLTDSKPPEPIDWKKYFPETEKFIHYYKESREDDYLDKTCNSCGQWLYKADSISCSECNKKNDKELILEFVNDLKTIAGYQYGDCEECDQILEKWEEKLK